MAGHVWEEYAEERVNEAMSIVQQQAAGTLASSNVIGRQLIISKQALDQQIKDREKRIAAGSGFLQTILNMVGGASDELDAKAKISSLLQRSAELDIKIQENAALQSNATGLAQKINELQARLAKSQTQTAQQIPASNQALTATIAPCLACGKNTIPPTPAASNTAIDDITTLEECQAHARILQTQVTSIKAWMLEKLTDAQKRAVKQLAGWAETRSSNQIIQEVIDLTAAIRAENRDPTTIEDNRLEELSEALKTHPDIIKAKEKEMSEYDSLYKDEEEQALADMRNLLPPNIVGGTKENMLTYGIPESLADKIVDKRPLFQIIHMDPVRIKMQSLKDWVIWEGHWKSLTFWELKAFYRALNVELANAPDSQSKRYYQTQLYEALKQLRQLKADNTLKPFRAFDRAYDTLKAHLESVDIATI
jgi:hypothetical protein